MRNPLSREGTASTRTDKDIPPPYRSGDIPFLGVVVFAALILLKVVTSSGETRGSEKVVEILFQGKSLIEKIPESESEKTITVSGPLGDSTICISCDGAKFTSSPCPSHICMKQGLISRTNESAACVPNNIIITIKSSSPGNKEVSSSLDGFTR